MWRFVAALITASLALSASAQMALPRATPVMQAWWDFDASLTAKCTTTDLSGAPCPPTQALQASSAPGATAQLMWGGRPGGGYAAQVASATGGYQVTFSQQFTAHSGGQATYPYGFAWMAFVYPTQLGSTQALIWNEGASGSSYVAGFSVALSYRGQVLASVGHGGIWKTTLASQTLLPTNAWHHVALVWDTQKYWLLVDGVYEASAADALPPDEGPNVPISFGFYNQNNHPKFILTGGAIDDVKFVKFPANTFAVSTQGSLANMDSTYNNFVLGEHGLMLRLQVLTDMASQGFIPATYSAYAQFGAATSYSTSMLRAWVNSFYTQKRVTQAPGGLDPVPSSSMAIVYPANGFPNAPQGYAGYNSIWNGGETPAQQNSLYLRIRDGLTMGWCVSAGVILRGVFKAFGYQARNMGWISPPADWVDTNAHYLTEVYLTDQNRYVIQDATYNIWGQNTLTSNYDSIESLYGYHQNPPASFPYACSVAGASNATNARLCSTNTAPIPAWTPTVDNYFPYFDTVWRTVTAADP